MTRYLEAVAEALRPAGRGVPSRTWPSSAATVRSTSRTRPRPPRVRELIDDGIRAGAFRKVSAAFVGEVVTATMRRITTGEIGRATGLDDARRTRSWPD